MLARAAALAASARRIARLEPAIGAWEHLALDRAAPWAASNASAGEMDAGQPLAGLPIGIKDVFDTADMPTAYGSPIFAGHQPAEDAWVVARLRSAGAVIAGKTVTTEFAYLHPSRTANPHDAGRTPGGSSSGSAAAVASGMVPLALGTQTAGSTIRPAAYCGVFGYKPTFGVVPMRGCRPLAPSLDTVGMFAHELPLLATLAQVLSEGRIDGGHHVRIAAPRIRLVDPGLFGCEASIRQLFDSLAGLPARGAASCEEAPQLPLQDIVRLHRLILSYEAAREHRTLVDTRRDLVSAPFQALMEEGGLHTAADYDAALRETAALRASFDREFTHFDVLVLPSATGEAPLRSAGTGNPDCCRLASLLGLPAINVPAGTGPAGLPVGVQLVCRAGHDATLLRLAGWLASRLQAP